MVAVLIAGLMILLIPKHPASKEILESRVGADLVETEIGL